ncbi:MAG TPA: hypothetical protein PLG09_10865 [Syntrophomonadaceae bacterium]|nr:hypothetical protein [Syntrophomonadaceae bacterium]HOQ10610.1 hypothetical protein [Syntrophomonadaceae bacterium]HPU49355.1 hypothetical protein [Syntrophomonadaceae bacterium]
MPIGNRIGGKSKPESEAMSAAKGKFNKSFANTLFGTVNDFFYEFGIIGKRDSENKKKDEQ